jgi:hypothetical protein
MSSTAFSDAARLDGVEYLDTTATFAGHETCAPSEWIRFPTVSVAGLLRDPSKVISGGSFHPNASGQQVFARIVACYLEERPQRAAEIAQSAPTDPNLVGCAVNAR